MPNRIDLKFRELKKKRKKAFIAFLSAGDPNLKTTEELVVSFSGAGVDLVELGVPFSDPLADGPTIQAASQRALANGVDLDKILQLVKNIRRRSQIPLALMTYYNPVFHYGQEAFVRKARQCGLDGLIVPDLPPEEAADLIRLARRQGMSLIFFLSVTTTPQRMKKIVAKSTGFIYYVSLTGVTGVRRRLPADLLQNLRSVKRMTGQPVCVGFGISTPQQVKAIAACADGVIIGSAIVKKIEENIGRKDLVKRVTDFVGQLARPLLLTYA